MKLYTLEYNCNTPTVQQINVPTNTDYKVGIKVVRNGKEQTLAPSEVTFGTLSADSVTTNGYITFTEEAGDEAFCVQKTIDIEHDYDIVSYTNTLHNTSGARQDNLSVVVQNAGDLGLAGKTITAETFLVYKKTNLSAEPTAQEIEANLASYWDMTSSSGVANFTAMVSGSQGVIYFLSEATKAEVLRAFKEEGRWTEADGPVFMFARPGATNYEPLKEYTFDGSETIYLGANRLQNNNYLVGVVKFLTGTAPFNAKFKLVENIYNSQQGDKTDIGNGRTADLAGKYADGTDFNYKLVIS